MSAPGTLRRPTIPAASRANELTVEFTLLGMPFVGLNGGPQFKITEAISFQVYTDSQEETDRYWDAIVRNGGEEGPCGWCKDKFGLSWQIVPRALLRAFADSDKAAAKRAMDAMMGMKRIDIAAIERARARGAGLVEPATCPVGCVLGFPICYMLARRPPK